MTRSYPRAVLFAIVCIAFVANAAAQGRTVAISPLANAGPSKADDYLGFQFAEFASGALAGIPGIVVVERSRLAEILSEQELQLSGITEAAGAAKIGAILNAEVMLTGSFTVGKSGANATTLRLAGRFVDVSTGAVLGAAEISGPFSGDASPLFRPFLERLLSATPGFGFTIGVEARIASLESEDAGASADYARALAAQFVKNDAEARKYLEAVVTGDRLLTSSYAAAAASYVDTVTRIEGSGIYARMLQSQVDKNARLMEQVEPLSIYRNTLKILLTRLTSLAREQDLRIGAAGDEQMEFGDVSAVVRLPAVTMSFDPTVRAAMERVIGEQDIIRLDAGGLRLVKAPPAGRLLSSTAMAGLFDLTLLAQAAYSVVFHDKSGAELFRLDSEPATVLELLPGSARYQAGAGTLRAAKPRNGWALRADGGIEIQARELAALAGVKYVIRSGSFKLDGTYPVGSDLRWKSLVMHAYRKQYIKIAKPGDPSPSIKDAVIADSFFETADPDLGQIPIAPEDGRRAGYAQLTAVVYFGDATGTTVQATWDGMIKGESKPFTGALDPRSVLYFQAPSVGYHAGSQTVTVKVGTDQARTERVSLALGSSWKNLNADAALVGGGTIWFTSYNNDRTAAVQYDTGKVLWSNSFDGTALATDGRFFYGVSGSVVCMDGSTGKEVWRNSGMRGSDIMFEAGRLFVVNSSYAICLDPATGNTLWRTDQGKGGNLGGFPVLSSGRLYLAQSSTTAALDAVTGQVLWTARRGGSAMVIAERRVYLSSGWVLDADTGKEITQYKLSFTGGTMLQAGSTIFISSGSRTLAFNRLNGATYWEAQVGGESLAVADGKLYVGGKYALDLTTGKEIWRSSLSSSALAIEGKRLFIGGNMLDLSVLERE